MIRTDQLTRTFGSRDRAVTALDGVTLSLEPGVWGVVGPNGAGKTTLLGLVLGFLRPTAGSIALDGLPPRRYVRRHGAAYLPERFRLPPAWPVAGALTALARLEGPGRNEARARVDHALDRLGLADHRDRPVGDLSRGLLQRVGIAQALLADRPLVVLDEPTEGLDPLWRVRFRDIVRELKPGRTVLLASHELSEVERITDRVVLLDDGRVRDTFDSRQPAGETRRYRLRVDGDRARLLQAFPDARLSDDAADTAATGAAAGTGLRPAATGHGEGAGRIEATVATADPRDLSDRLAAFLADGGTIHAVEPLSDDLETRVRRRLERDE